MCFTSTRNLALVTLLLLPNSVMPRLHKQVEQDEVPEIAQEESPAKHLSI